MSYQETAKWFISKDKCTPQRLLYYLYFYHAWATALLDSETEELEFVVTPKGIANKELKRTYVMKYGNDIIPKENEVINVSNEWLHQSVLATYKAFSTKELLQIIMQDPPYMLAKTRKRFRNHILTNELQKHYRFLYSKNF